MSKEFIEFEFNGIKSSTLGIIRVSDGSRYNEDLLPTSTDKTVTVPGKDGVYYFGTNYSQRQFQIQIAFDSLTLSQIQNMRKLLGANQIGKLKFSEDGIDGEIYSNQKYYMAKSSGVQQLKYICFNENGVDLYKGEGTITFICYYPFGMIDKVTSSSVTFTNNGDIDCPCKITCASSALSSFSAISLNGVQKMTFPSTGISLSSADPGNNLVVDTDSHLIYTTTSTGARTGYLYNSQIASGDFFNIPTGESNTITTGASTSIAFSELYY